MHEYLIIGAGAAGMEAALSVRAADPASSVTIITDERFTHYFRPKLVHFLASDELSEELQVHDAEWYRTNGIVFVADRRIVHLDNAAKTATDDRGSVYRWDRLLLATGGRAFVPPVAGAGRPGVFSLRSLDDALAVRAYSAGRKRAVVVGGGLLGLENAYALASRGIEVTVVEFAPWLLPRQLDREGGVYLRSLLESKGLRFLLDDQVVSIDGEGTAGAAEGVTLKSGTRLEADMVVVSIGIRADTALAVEAGIAVNKGIVVDDRLETSVPGVYAAGDAAEHRGVCYGLWTVAREQGRAAGTNMAGGNEAYRGSSPSSQLKITGIDLYSAGDVAALAQVEETGTLISEADDGGYRKLGLGPDGKPRAVMVIGDRSAIQIARRIMAGTAAPGELVRAEGALG